MRQIADTSEKYFVLEDWHNFGADYDKTLMAWYERFLAAWPAIASNYNERFKRMFTYFLTPVWARFAHATFNCGRSYLPAVLKTGCVFPVSRNYPH